jgi:hypothetical protein
LNNSYLKYTNNILFNYSAEDPDGLYFCSLYGNWGGGWHKNQTIQLKWYNYSWDKRKSITFLWKSHICLTNFPMLIDIYDTDLSNSTRSDGYDIFLQFRCFNKISS